MGTRFFDAIRIHVIFFSYFCSAIYTYNNQSKTYPIMQIPFAEAWKIKMVEPIKKSTRAEREKWLEEAHNNIFMLKSDYVYIDLLTDSGTGAMSDRQWSAMMMGDESYGGARSFYHMKDTITALTGFNYVIPTHQGRAAENVLFSYLVKPGMVIPGNAHFDTTKGHIESRKAFAIDVTIPEAKDTQLELPFKGNVSLELLENSKATSASNCLRRCSRRIRATCPSWCSPSRTTPSADSPSA